MNVSDGIRAVRLPLCGGMVGGEPWVVAALLRCLVGSLGGSSYSLRREGGRRGEESAFNSVNVGLTPVNAHLNVRQLSGCPLPASKVSTVCACVYQKDPGNKSVASLKRLLQIQSQQIIHVPFLSLMDGRRPHCY